MSEHFKRGGDMWAGLRSHLTAKRVEGDYVDPADGLLHCGVCRCPKEKPVEAGEEFFGLDRRRVPCRCEQERLDREEADRRQQEHRQRVAELRRKAFSFIPGGDWRFEAGEATPQMERVRRYADRWEEFSAQGVGLLLFGGVGTGKSFAAGCVANALVEREVTVRFLGVSDIVNRMQGCTGDQRQYLLDKLLRADLLILDDLGAERDTGFGREQVFDVVNKRTLSGRPMLVTTNIDLHEMQKAQGVAEGRIYDRVLEVCVPIHFQGESFRRRTGARHLREAARLLKD